MSIVIERIIFSNKTIYDKKDEINKNFFEKLVTDKLINLTKDLKEFELEIFTESNEFKIYLYLNYSLANEEMPKFDGKNILKLMKMMESFRNKKFSEMNIKRSLLFNNKN